MLNNYPWVLRNTLFHSKKYNYLRGKESSNLFFLADEVKNDGNTAFKKGNYYEALNHYE